jgi:AAA+ ATPase superfamily predicted ATPase
MFRTNVPVVAEAFHDRSRELEQLEAALDALEQGNPRWIALLGNRKVGKTSLLLELERRRRAASMAFVVIDSFERRPVALPIFRRFALRAVDAFFSRQLGLSLEAIAHDPDDYRAVVSRLPQAPKLPQQLLRTLLSLADRELDESYVDAALRLPQQLAEALDARCVVAWDEFQKLTRIRTSARESIDLLALARSIWQRHDRVAYLISGSERSMMLELLSSDQSPFFQHFSLLEIGAMSREDALSLLVERAPEDHSIPEEIAARAYELLGGHPFYLQLFGETLTAQPPPYDDRAFKHVCGELLFSKTGRLSLYFQRELDQLVGRASSLSATLQALTGGPRRVTDVARAIGSTTASTLHYLQRLGSAIVRRDDGLYELADPVFGVWLRWRGPGGAVVPMSVIGNEAELLVARRLAEMGFELVYQSRASRGAFDLLAVRGGQQVGVQVKRSKLPLRFKKTEWNRLRADAERFGWRGLVAAVAPPPDETVFFLDPERALVRRAVTIDASAALDNVLTWLG